MDTEKLSQEMMEALADLARTPIKNYWGSVCGEMGVLLYLTFWGEAAPSEISRVFAISTARATMILAGLQRKGFVERSRPPGDRRRIAVSVTEQGSAAARQQADEMLRHIQTVMEGLGEADARELLRLVKRIVEVCRTGFSAGKIEGGIHT